MSEPSDRLARRLLEDGEKTRAFFDTLKAEQWERMVYTEGACWSVRQILAHFVASEAAILRLVGHILDGGAGVPEDFNLNAYNERKVAELELLSVSELLQRFVQLRQVTADRVLRIQPEELGRTGRHPFLGIAAVEDIIKLIYRHNQIHIREIRQGIIG